VYASRRLTPHWSRRPPASAALPLSGAAHRERSAAEGPAVQRLDNNDFGFRCRTPLVTLNLWTKNSSDG